MQQQTKPALKRATNSTKTGTKIAKHISETHTQEQQPMRHIFTSFLIILLTAANIYAQDSPQWHLPEGAKARLGKGAIEQIAYSPDRTMLAAATYIGVWLYDVQTGNELQLLATEPAAVQSIAFSPRRHEACRFGERRTTQSVGCGKRETPPYLPSRNQLVQQRSRI